MPRDVPMLDAYYAYCPAYDHHVGHPQFGRVIVGTQSEINRELDRPSKERMPCWDGVLSCGYSPAREDLRVQVLLANFIALIIRDRIDPKVAHEAFLQIPEYRRHLANDTPGISAYDD